MLDRLEHRVRRATQAPGFARTLGMVGPWPGIEKFVVFAPPRSGSDMLLDLLRSHPSVAADGELLAKPQRAPEAFVRGRARRAQLRGRSAWGFKLLFEHARWSADWHPSFGGASLLERLAHEGWAVIFLRRRSLLAQVLSLMHAEDRASGSAWRGHFTDDDGFEFRPFRADPADVVSRLVLVEEYLLWAEEATADLPTLDVFYEDDLLDAGRHQDTADRIFERLGVRSVAVESRLRRVTPHRLRDRLDNDREVDQVLSLTRFAGQFDVDEA